MKGPKPERALGEQTRVAACREAVLRRENDALRRNNTWQARRIAELETEIGELRRVFLEGAGMKNADLLKRIEELERQVRELQARPVYVPVAIPLPPPAPGPNYAPWQPTIWCDGHPHPLQTASVPHVPTPYETRVIS
jgi:hypothetical protein